MGGGYKVDPALAQKTAEREEEEKKREIALKKSESSKRRAAAGANAGTRSLLAGLETGVDSMGRRTKLG